MDDNKEKMANFMEIPVLCTNGMRAPLSTCYMPLWELCSVQLRLSSADILPFLNIPPASDAELLSKWSFLADNAGVSGRRCLDFLMDLKRFVYPG